MNKPARLITEEKAASGTAPALIVDKTGVLGEKILQKLANDFFVVYVSGRKPKINNLNTSNVFYVPFLKRFSQIPENFYSYIFAIDEGGVFIRESFNAFIQKARENRSQLIYITNLRCASWSFINEIKGQYKKLKIFIYGDIFGDDFNEGNFFLNNLIYQAKKQRRIEIPGEGMEKIFPIFSSDAVDEILKTSFGPEHSEKIFYLFPRHPRTYLSLANLLQKTDPDIKIDFVKKEKENREIKIFYDEGVYLIEDQYPLQKKLNEAEIKLDDSRKREGSKKNARILRKAVYIFKFFLLSASILLVLPFISTVLFSFLGYLEVKNSINMFKNGSLERAFNSSSIAENFFKISRASANGFTFELVFFGQNKTAEFLISKINAGIKLAKGINYLSQAGHTFINTSSKEENNSWRKILDTQSLIRNAIVAVQEIYLEADLSDLYRTEIDRYANLIKGLSVFQEVLPDIVGMEAKKNYLIIFQNNMELRPGGGFIGSYGILTLNKGRIEDFVINDVYDADGQLKRHIEPPFPIRRYLQKVHWYMRDSNFDLDFPQSAYTVSFFLNEETGQKVDGVIAIDVSFLKALLKEIGPVEVPEYSEIVDSQNMYLLTQTHAEKDFFPSSTQKKDFLRSLARAIQIKISEKKNLSYLSILEAVMRSLEEKHVVFYFNNANLQSLFTASGWSSSLWDNRKADSSIINDFLGINEANLGVNKANFFIERSISSEININESGSVSSRMTVVYKNNSIDWPGGDYKSYIRFILPQKSSLSQVFIDGIPQRIGSAITDPLVYEQKNFIPPQLLEIEKTEERGKTIYGFLIVVPKKETKTVAIDYELPQNIKENSPAILYNLKYFKQPGTEIYPFNLTIIFPSSYQVVSSSDNLNIVSGKAVFSSKIYKDENFILSLGHK